MAESIRADKLDIGERANTPAGVMSLSEEFTMLRKRVRSWIKESVA